MILNKKQAFIHKAKKARLGEKDIDDKFRIIKLLKQKFDLIALTGEVISIPGKIYHRMPDLYCPAIKTVIELDGPIHGFGDQISIKLRDIERDEDYKVAGLNEIIISSSKTDGYKDDLVIKELIEQGLGKNV